MADGSPIGTGSLDRTILLRSSQSGSQSSPEAPPPAKRCRGSAKRGRGCRGRAKRGRGRDVDAGVAPASGSSSKAKKTTKGRGKQKQLYMPDTERLQQLREERQQRAKSLIGRLSGDEAKELLFQMTETNASVILDIHQKLQQNADGGQSPPHNQPYDVPGWCVCGRCTEMPTDVERLCCGHEPDDCVSLMAEMDLYVLDPMVLSLQQAYRNDLFALNALQETDKNKASRHAAYRQFILWQFGRLGQGDRRVVPSCCVNRIRHTFPDPNGHYTGYKAGRLL